MSRFESSYRRYERMSVNGLRSMTGKEIVEEAIDTIKIGKRKSIYGKDMLESFFNSGLQDQSLCREGLIDMQNGLEMLLKGLIEYYGEAYIEEHYTNRNCDILDGLSREYPELNDLRDAFSILRDDDFSFTMYKCSKFPRYSTFRTNKQFRNLAYRLVDLLNRYIDMHIFND